MSNARAIGIITTKIKELALESDEHGKQITNLLNLKEQIDEIIQELNESVQILSNRENR